MHSFIKKFLAGSILTASTIGTYKYHTTAPSTQILTGPTIFDEEKLSDHFKTYIKEKNLKFPFFSNLYQSGLTPPTFLEGSILKGIQGLDYYNLYIEKSYQDVLSEEVDIPEQARLEMDKDAKLYCIFIPNENLENNSGVVHHGFVSTLLDSMGAYLTLMVDDFVPPVTAKLNVECHNRMEIGERVFISSQSWTY